VRYICIVLLVLVSITGYAQSTYLKGIVKLERSQQTLADIYIYLEDQQMGDLSDANGAFQMGPLKSGTDRLIVSALGFEDKIIAIQIPENTSELTIEIELKETINSLPTIEINSQSTTGGLLGNMSSPGSQHYISSKDIAEIQTTNPHAILERIPGVQIQEEDGFGLRPNIGLRGSGSERSSKITIMEDGIPAAPAPYAAPSAYYFPTMARMSGIEVLKGSAQIVHGPFTTSGVINLISTPLPSSFKGKVSMGGGSFGGRNIHAHIGDKIGQFSYLVETFQYKADGFKKIDFTDQNTGFNKEDYLAKLRWTAPSSAKIFQMVELKLGESDEVSDETYLGLQYDDFLEDPYRRYAGSQEDEMVTSHQQISLKHLITPLKNLHIQTTAYQNNFKRNWYKLDKVRTPDGASVGISSLLNEASMNSDAYDFITGSSESDSSLLLVKANNRAYLSKGVMTRINYSHGRHQFEMGLRLHSDEMDRFQWVDDYRLINGIMKLDQAGVKGTESNRIESANAVASYIQHKVTFDKWTFTSGLRNERVEISRRNYGSDDPERQGTNVSERINSVSAWIPGINIQYRFSSDKELFGGVHRGFAPPGSSPDTDPELSINYEVGYRQQLGSFYGNLTAYYNDYQNLLGADFASSGGLGTGDAFNGGEATAYGVEAAVNYRHQISEEFWIPIQGQYTYTHATFDNDFESAFDAWGNVKSGDFIPYIADHTFTISSGLRHEKFSVNLTGSYMGNMRLTAGQDPLTAGNHIPSRLILSGNIAYHLKHNFTFRLGAQNLSNSVYAVAARPAGWRPGVPRNISINAEVRF